MIRPGDRLVLESGGGGGWGDPAKRDPAAIAEDVYERICDPMTWRLLVSFSRLASAVIAETSAIMTSDTLES